MFTIEPCMDCCFIRLEPSCVTRNVPFRFTSITYAIGIAALLSANLVAYLGKYSLYCKRLEPQLCYHKSPLQIHIAITLEIGIVVNSV